MSRERTYWAAHLSLESLLPKGQEHVNLWTFTGKEQAMRQNRKLFMRQWGKMQGDRAWRGLRMRGLRSSEKGTKGEGCYHIHFETPFFYKIEEVKAVAERYGFGRINVKQVPNVGYAIKYVMKDRNEPFERSWACVGFKGVRVQDVRIDNEFKARAVESRTRFPGKMEGAGAYWWQECLQGLACSYGQGGTHYPWKPMRPEMDSYELTPEEGQLVGGWMAKVHAGSAYVRPATFVCLHEFEYNIRNTQTGAVRWLVVAWYLVEINSRPVWVRAKGKLPGQLPERGERVLVNTRQAIKCDGLGVIAGQADGRLLTAPQRVESQTDKQKLAELPF